MNYLLHLTIVAFIISTSCKSTTKATTTEKHTVKHSDTIKISNPKLEYDIVIIEPGYTIWLQTTAKPKGFYSKNYLETKNYNYVTAWNARVQQPQRFNPNLYEMTIDYQKQIDYGYDVNYQLYNYFIYFQNKYNQNLLGGRIPAN